MDNWRAGFKDLKIDTDRKDQLDFEEGELTPDSMSSRLVDSAIGMNDKKMSDFMFDSMNSRVNTMAA